MKVDLLSVKKYMLLSGGIIAKAKNRNQKIDEILPDEDYDELNRLFQISNSKECHKDMIGHSFNIG